MPENIVDRLRLTEERLAGMVQGLRDVVALPDPVGEVVRGSTLANGLELRQVRMPFGVVGIIYEARPNVTADAAGICLKSGNAVLLRGSSSARTSNATIVGVLRGAAVASGLAADVVQLVPGDSHDSVQALMRARGLVDVLIPRGGAALIRSVVEGSTVPVIETGVGNCHVYVDRAADLEQALAIVLNAKTHRTSVCDAGVTIHGDDAFAAYDGVLAATDDDYGREYLSLDISAAVVTDLGGGAGQRVDPVHRRRRVRLRGGDRHQHPEAPCARPHGTGRDDLDQVHRDRVRSRPLRQYRPGPVGCAHVVDVAERAHPAGPGGHRRRGQPLGHRWNHLGHSDGADRRAADVRLGTRAQLSTAAGRRAQPARSGSRRVGVMGGTFDPIHHGHLVAASEVQAWFDLDEVIFVPTGDPWQKSDRDVSPAEDRYLMTVIATAANPRFNVSRVDIDRSGPTYTIDTLLDLRAAMPDAELYFITGADALADIFTWRDASELFELAKFVGCTRPGYTMDRATLDSIPSDRVTMVEIPALAISSSDCRDRSRRGEPVWYLVPDGVVQYLAKHDLYPHQVTGTQPATHEKDTA